MINHCINPLCDEEMKRFGIGELYSHEIREVTSPARKTEFFWICPTCAIFLTIRLDKEGNPIAAPKSEAAGARWPHPGHDLRLAFVTGSGSRYASPRMHSQAALSVLPVLRSPIFGEVA